MRFILTFILFKLIVYGQTIDLPINCSNINNSLKIIDSIRINQKTDFFSYGWSNNGQCKTILYKKNHLVCVSIDNYICFFREQNGVKFKLYIEGNSFEYTLNKDHKVKKIRIIENIEQAPLFTIKYKGEEIIYKQKTGNKIIKPTPKSILDLVSFINKIPI